MLKVQKDEHLDQLVFSAPGGKTRNVKIVASDTRCLLWNKSSNTAHELIFKDAKAEPTVKRVWEDKDDPVTNIIGGCDGRFVVCTSETAYILNGDKLEKVEIADEWVGSANNRWALGDGWEIFNGEKVYGRGKSGYLQATLPGPTLER